MSIWENYIIEKNFQFNTPTFIRWCHVLAKCLQLPWTVLLKEKKEKRKKEKKTLCIKLYSAMKYKLWMRSHYFQQDDQLMLIFLHMVQTYRSKCYHKIIFHRQQVYSSFLQWVIFAVSNEWFLQQDESYFCTDSFLQPDKWVLGTSNK